MQSAINKNSERKGNKYLETFQGVRRGASIHQSRTPIAQEVQEQTILPWLFLICPEAGEKLSGAFLAQKVWECMNHPFPEASSVGSERRGQSDRERGRVRALYWTPWGTVGCNVQALGPRVLSFQAIAPTNPVPSQPRDVLSLRRERKQWCQAQSRS